MVALAQGIERCDIFWAMKALSREEEKSERSLCDGIN